MGLDALLHSGYQFRSIRLVNWFFPPRPRKLLTQAEYEAIGRRETEKELEKLRQFCNSPQCKSWSLVKRLHTPSRFSEFVDAGQHLTPDEVDSYEREVSFDGVENEDDDASDDSDRSPATGTSFAASNGHGSSTSHNLAGQRSFANRFGGRGLQFRGRGSRNSPGFDGHFPGFNSSRNNGEPMDYE